jgi:hypothetical protein
MSATIEAVLRLRDQLSAPLRSAAGSLTDATQSVNSLDNSLKNAAASADGMKGKLAGALGAIGVGIGFKEILSLSSNFEDTALSIAGNIKAFDLAPTFTEAKDAASKALVTINDMAAKLPGEAEDYIQVFKTALPAAIRSGLTDIKQVSEFTSKLTAVAVSNQIDAAQAGADLMRMLSGQAGMDNRTWMALAPHIKVTTDLLKHNSKELKGLGVGSEIVAEKFNKLDISVRRNLIESALGRFDEQMKDAGDTYSSKMGELTSRVKELLRLASEPMFEAAKDALTKINKYLEDNKDLLKDQLQNFMQIATDYIPKIADGIGWVVKHAEEIKDAMVVAMDLWIASTTLSALNNVLGVFQKMAAAATTIGAMQLGTGGGYGPAMTVGTRLASWGRIGAGYGARALAGTASAAALGAGAFLYSKEANADEDFQLVTARQRMEDQRAKEEAAALEAANAELEASVADRFNLDKYKSPEKKPPKFDFRNSRFDIKQQFAEGFDQDRIAVAFASDLARVGEMKLQSAVGMRSGFVR